MSLEGTVINGVIVLDPGSMLPDGTRVEVKERDEAAPLPPAGEAARLRVAWMTVMGFSSDEVRQSFDDDPPIDPAKEIAELKAAEALKKLTPSAGQLDAWAARSNRLA